MGGDDSIKAIFSGLRNFYSRPRVGGDHRVWQLRQLLKDFYSRPRVGGDFFMRSPFRSESISTHAPAWGATSSAT